MKTNHVAALEDTVSRMQRDLEELQSENRFLRTPRASRPVPLVRQAALTTTKVPWFNNAIVLSNGWGDATAALQLLSHLQDDALSVALLIPMTLQASRKVLTDALSSHYGSPGRLANYRREFDKTVRKRGKILPISLLPWRRWLLKHLVISFRQPGIYRVARPYRLKTYHKNRGLKSQHHTA